MKGRLLIYFILLLSLSSCRKEDLAVTLPPPGDLEQQSAALGLNYEYQAYVSLANNTVIRRSYMDLYDLAFEASPQGTRVYLNGARMMFACATGTCDMATADTVGKPWRFDQEKMDPDSTALGNWWNSTLISNYGSEVYVIDRGSQYTAIDRFRKFQIISVSGEKFQVRFSKCDNTGLTVMNIPKDSAYSLMYMSFNNGGQMVQIAPPKDQWDFVFTRYTHEYFDQPVGTPYRHYIVTGAILNCWNGVSGSKHKKDSTLNYVSFDSCSFNRVVYYPCSPNADIIGYDWKYYIINDGKYYLVPDVYFVIEDKNGLYYKLRMLDYYDPLGNKGTVTYQYQRM